MEIVNKRLILVFCVVLLFVTGFNGCSTTKDVSGGPGLLISFKEGQPPSKIYASDRDNFRFGINIVNYGDEDVSGTIYLSDTPADRFGNLQGRLEQNFMISGGEFEGEKFYPGKETVVFGPFHYYKDEIYEGMKTQFKVEVNIDKYEANIDTGICVKRADVEAAKPGCQDVSLISVSDLGRRALSIPVTIEKIEKRVSSAGDELVNVNLDLYFKNLGSGEINNEEKVIQNFNINLLGADFICNPTEISLVYGEKKVSCNADIELDEEENLVEDKLELSFNYPYKIVKYSNEIEVV